ncbi:MAG TPA: tripartite tricarboxylate transporter TctB family protein [Clostridiaceae bacterium]|nr:tripartite tricarboxylate transporter TctB family protein [Clostridiaceae bacterium]
MKKANIIVSCLVLILSLYVFVETAQFPEDPVLLVGPAFFPRLLAGCLAILGLVLLVQALRGKTNCTDPGFNLKGGVQRLLVTFLGLSICIVLLPKLGFIVTGVMLLIFLMVLFGLRNFPIIILSSIGVAVSVYLAFHNLLNIALPEGLIGL